LGDVVATLSNRGHLRRCGVIGLGCGTIAAYAQTGTRFDFFEIDPLVVRIAADRRFFSYVFDAIGRGAQVTATVGDGRLAIAAMPALAYDLVVVDAFASDSVPLHLLTREALAVYAERLHPAGLIAFNVSSRYFDLAPPIAAVAATLNLASIVRRDTVISQDDREAGKRESIWVVVGSEAALAPLRGRGGWVSLLQRLKRRFGKDAVGRMLSEDGPMSLPNSNSISTTGSTSTYTGFVFENCRKPNKGQRYH
jgi:hypothetical protein